MRIAIIGDSNITGLILDTDKHIDAQLRELLGQNVDIFSFGISGAPKSQFVGAAQYIETFFDPDIFLVFIREEAVNKADKKLKSHDIELAKFLMDKMSKTLPDDKIIFFSDALRSLLYRENTIPGPTIDFRLLEAANDPGSRIELLDLTLAMWEDYARNEHHFESTWDPHWNERGHMIAAQALFKVMDPSLHSVP